MGLSDAGFGHKIGCSHEHGEGPDATWGPQEMHVHKRLHAFFLVAADAEGCRIAARAELATSEHDIQIWAWPAVLRTTPGVLIRGGCVA